MKRWRPIRHWPSPFQKRDWCYAQPPQVYEVASCECGSQKFTWSEYKHRCWCFGCGRDYVPEHNGIFDGPIPMHLSVMMGIRFDRINLATGELERDLMCDEAEATLAAHRPFEIRE